MARQEAEVEKLRANQDMNYSFFFFYLALFSFVEAEKGDLSHLSIYSRLIFFSIFKAQVRVGIRLQGQILRKQYCAHWSYRDSLLSLTH